MPAGQESFARVGDVEICWQRFGDAGDPPMVLIMGIGAQMILWPDGFCEELAARGFGIVRFDNRDAGRSSVLDAAGVPSIQAALAGELRDPPYTLSDMAGDTAGLMDALGIEAAHVVGASMGGMIAQVLAIEQPERVLSLASVMSTTGDSDVGRPTPAALEALITRPPADRDGYIEATLSARAVIGSPGFETDEDTTRANAARAYERGIHPDGTTRQAVAMIATGNRTDRLRGLEVPTVVIHGADDPLITLSGGEATAAAIPGAERVVIDGMGHDFPPGVWVRVADAIEANARRAVRRAT
ncbi:MAG: alpha/beta fold hydrolase [Actinomycetota bacterium]|nr:alpha/beta fold hydrolase [Actinomycetota bacterium]